MTSVSISYVSACVAALTVGVVLGIGIGQWGSSGKNVNHAYNAAIAKVVIDRIRGIDEIATEGRVGKLSARTATTPSVAAPAAEPETAYPQAEPLTLKSLNQSERPRRRSSFGEQHRTARDIGTDSPAWQRFAVPVVIPSNAPLMSIVIDDLGINVRNAARTIALQGPLTLAFMSYARNLRAQTETARAAGHELLLHLPMEPQDYDEDPGPNVLLTRLSPEENLFRLRWALERFEGYIGVNNHMGSRFTQDEKNMALVMNELSARGLIFLDSRTVRGSVSGRVARKFGVPFIGRDVFLDNEPTMEKVLERLVELEAVARRYGRAIGISHPHKGTLDALDSWLPKMAERGFALVPLSALVLHPPGSG